MARRMYDLDNGVENIRIKNLNIDGNVQGRGYFEFENDGDFFGIDSTAVYTNKAIMLGAFDSLDRPILPSPGIIFDVTLGKLILWNGTAWVNLDGTALS